MTTKEAKNEKMADTEEKKDKKKTVSATTKRKGTLSLKGGTGKAGGRTSRTSGRTSRNVAVEVRKKRGAAAESAPGSSAGDEDQDPRLTTAEREARIRALEKAKTDGGPDASSQDRYQSKLVVKTREEPEAEKTPTKEKTPSKRPGFAAPSASDSTGPAGRRSGRRTASPRDDQNTTRRKPSGLGGPQRRRSGRLTVSQALNPDSLEGRTQSLAAQRRAKARQRAKMQMQEPKEHVKQIRDVVLPEVITVQELANRMTERVGEVVKKLMDMGIMATANQSIDADTAELIIHEFGHTLTRVSESDVELGLHGEEDTADQLKPRPPVVTIMGHVDHGKTSLLDAMRKTDVVAGEAGGITQHIGAYQIQTKDKKKITFIDTPGHAAFTEMRARGADVTDIVILVVAADDSVKPQTIEAINHAKLAEKPIILAINKCDLPAADPQKVRTDLLQHELVTEDMGGDVQAIEVSAVSGKGLKELEEAILLQAEVMDLKANPDRACQGAVVEARQEVGKGSVATVLVQKGTLNQGDIFITGSEWGRVRAMYNDHGKKIKKAIPGQPVEVLGLNSTPEAGDDFIAVENEKRASEISDYRQRKKRALTAAKLKSRGIDQMIAEIQAGKAKILPVIVKGDVHGSVEAITSALDKLTEDNTEVQVKVLHAGVGAITESDITMSSASNAFIVGFNVRATPQARDMAKRDGVEIRYYSIIYEALDDVKNLLSGMLSPDVKENFIGYAEIRKVFSVPKAGKVAGCYVTEGMVKRGAKVRLLRDNIVIHEGTLKTLRRFKDEVKEVQKDYECGMAFESYDDLKEGDMIEAFEMVESARTLESKSG